MVSGVTDDQIIRALEAKGGFITHAAKALNMTYQAVYYRLKKNPKLKEALDAIQESHLDMAEIKLLQKIKDDELGAICFYLKCKGKGRGYVERQQQEVTVSSVKAPESIKVEIVDASQNSGK